MNRQFDFLMPSVNFFVPGVIAKIGDRAKMLNMHKPLVVTQESLEKIENGPVVQTIESLKKRSVTPSSLLVGALLTTVVRESVLS